MENNTKHWVEELFTPHFSAEDFLRESLEPELLLSEKLAKERAMKIETIYKAAVCEFQEKDKKKKRELLSKMIIHEPCVQDQSVTAQHATCRACLKADNACDTASNSSGHCLWSEKELNLLRAEMNKKHSEGARFNLQLRACKLEISELKAKQKETEKKLEALKVALAASKRENECKRVLINQLKKDGEKREADLQSLRKDVHKKHATVQGLTTSMSKAREEAYHLQLQNTDLQQELDTLRQQHKLKILIVSEKTKHEYDAQIKKLLREIETLKEERQLVRHQHDQDVAELNLLRRLYIHEK
ncbi:coiled-coil domain-containing protein 160 [Anomaloglossus baeobatrachus]|uniref:coiled-coil domain-containing protein 160 n=1 Tax=Anomaloglossus baeobatrachus TaxID=238106 RepID=UPI003F50A472